MIRARCGWLSSSPEQSSILAGNHYPHQIGSLRQMLDSIASLDISAEERADILGNNTARLLMRD